MAPGNGIDHGRVRLTLLSNPDLVIRCQNQIFKVHQDQLLNNCTLLTEIQYNGIQDGTAEVQTKGIKPDALSCILDFLYTGNFDETGAKKYVPSTVLTTDDAHNGIVDVDGLCSPTCSQSTERHKRLASIYTLAQKYKIPRLKELVERKFANAGRISGYLKGILNDARLENPDLGSRLQIKLEGAAASSQDSSTMVSDKADGASFGGSATGATTPESFAPTPPEEEEEGEEIAIGPNTAPIVQGLAGGTDIATLKTLSLALQAELESLRLVHEEQTKRLQEQQPMLLVLQQGKFQAELSHATAQSRLDGLVTVLNDTQRCQNRSCQISLNVLVQESEIRTKGNVILRCGTCNARQR
ncbi:hypothetical protein DRE_07339 [Drechslerella stenobrocha 248]|uniref:BTB domain-containing protein n=1 Tax=Drechslerella stenobrocha 248 TaxID=1043628 RepID=W7HL57_9PEZI|nr:hypothetical protein DRE_07339 [Drechslerella stenobrocha 248]